MLDALGCLPSSGLKSLASSLRSGPLNVGITSFGVRDALGSINPEVEGSLRALVTQGATPMVIAMVVEAIVVGRAGKEDVSVLFDLVLSGPDVPGVPTADTAAVMRSLFSSSTKRVILVGYAIYNGKKLFATLADQMQQNPSLKAILCIDVRRTPQDTSPPEDIVARFSARFRSEHWPWARVPEVYYDPRSLEPSGPDSSSLHAKCVTVDTKFALVSSANFTDAALHRNIEAGVLIKSPPVVQRLERYFLGLIEAKVLRSLPIA